MKTQCQQITRYCQNKDINFSPKELFRKDFAEQCGKWRKDKERLIIVLDANEPTMDGPLRKMLDAERLRLEEFSRKY